MPRLTRDERAKLMEACKQMLAMGCYNGEIKRYVRAHFRIQSAAQINRYLRRAREALIASTQQTKTEYIAEALQFYRDMKQNAGSAKDQIKAQERIDKLLGLENQHITVEHKTAGEETREGVIELLEDEDYVEWCRQQAVQRDTDAGLVCQLDLAGDRQSLGNGEAHGGAGPSPSGGSNGTH